MNKKTIIAFLAIASILICGIAAAVFFLYKDVDTVSREGDSGMRKEKKMRQKVSRAVSDEADVLRAVPSDAVAVFTFDSFQEAVKLFSDDKRIFGTLVSSKGKYSLDRYISSLESGGVPEELRNADAAISLQYNGTLSPLLVVDCEHIPDSSSLVVEMLSKAQSLGLRSKAAELSGKTMLLVSASEADIVSSLKHIEAKASILDVKSFTRTLANYGRNAKLFFSGNGLDKVIPSLIASPYSAAEDFISTISEWAVADVYGSLGGPAVIDFRTAGSKGVSFFENVLTEIQSSPCELPRILPSNTVFAVGLCLGDADAYVASYCKYLDAHNRLRSVDKALDWIREEGICEVASASWLTSDGVTQKVLLARTREAAKDVDDVPAPNDRAGFLALLFGRAFSAADESVCTRRGEWLIFGSIEAVRKVSSMEKSLYEVLVEEDEASVFPVKAYGPLVYMDLSLIPHSAYKEPLAIRMKQTLSGVTAAPMVIAHQKDSWSLDIRRCSRLLSGTSQAASDIEVSKGPFEVTNCGTGKKNLFYQNDNLYLCLKETTGKGLWGVSFDKPICGAVGQVDHYANGKIQFLFCAESSLYLIDRLGRFCSGFPVDLGKPVLLGPAVYDFSGAKKYNVMVLHTDNTIEMYNLQGLKPASWKGITCPEAITALPVLKRTSSGQKYWEVSTSNNTYTFDFWGGESLKIKK